MTKHGYLQEGFVAGYQLCAAEKQAEIDALTARIAIDAARAKEPHHD